MKPYPDPKANQEKKYDPKDYGKQGGKQEQKPKQPQGQTDAPKQPYNKPGQMK